MRTVKRGAVLIAYALQFFAFSSILEQDILQMEAAKFFSERWPYRGGLVYISIAEGIITNWCDCFKLLLFGLKPSPNE